MSAPFAHAERRGQVIIVTIDRQERRNALHSPAHLEMEGIFDAFEADVDLRVAILTGAGEKAFCAGNDLKFQAEGGSLDRPPTGFGGLTLRFGRTKPIIAAVNGIAFGGGFEMVLACDLAVAARNARFSFPEMRRGLVPLAGVHTLPRQLPPKIAMDLLLTTRVLDAEGAARLGLVNEVVAEGGALDAALALADTVLAGSPAAIRACLQMAEASASTADLEEAMRAPNAVLDRLRASHDFREGPLAFSEGRPPRWQKPDL